VNFMSWLKLKKNIGKLKDAKVDRKQMSWGDC